eukprot:CAMPEP_0204007290 /NCGR_PEP_ID=MMETSP0360-20130528/20374_1 /ASSEMBLY_ACC=CAM_ASM_000342 /TAXON_ID=268821 /ORGANISM="Scrippsiella Hangoei, Strain SHTV-5" /LENGTH=38 /DNA_ID= /DNA_START= /DNA_END= /DNA_ORIENTATION=
MRAPLRDGFDLPAPTPAVAVVPTKDTATGALAAAVFQR